MGIEKLKDVYNPLTREEAIPGNQTRTSPAAETTPCTKLQGWKDSAAVVLLSEHMKRSAQHGIILYRPSDHRLALRFKPGLSAADVRQQTDRGRAAHAALELLQDAAHDLSYLCSQGLLNLPSTPNGGQP